MRFKPRNFFTLFIFIISILQANQLHAQAIPYKHILECAAEALFSNRYKYIKSIKVKNAVGETAELHELKPKNGGDGIYTRIDGEKILWKNISGRWRDHKDDEKVSFKMFPTKIVITIVEGGESRSVDYPLKRK